MQAVWRVGAASQSLGRPHVAPRGRGLSAPARRVSAPRTAPRARLALVGPCVRRRRPSDARSAERGERSRRPSDARSAERGGAFSIQYLLGCACATGFRTPPLPTAWLRLRRPSHARSAERGARRRRPSDARSAERGEVPPAVACPAARSPQALAAAAAAAAAAAGPAAFWKPLVLDTVVLRRCRVRVCVPHGGGAPSGASVHRNGYRDERDDGARARELARRAGAAHAATPPQPLPARAERPLRGPRQRRRAAAAAAAAAADIVDRMPRGHGLLRPRRAHHPAADGRTLAAPAHRCLAPLGRARGALRRVPVHADDGGPRAVAAPSGALVGSRRLWYSMLNVPVSM